MDINTVKLIAYFIAAAEKKDVYWELRREAGWYVKGENAINDKGGFIPPEEIPEEHKIPNKRGYAIAVDGHFYVDAEDNEALYPNIETALEHGIQLLNDTENEK